MKVSSKSFRMVLASTLMMWAGLPALAGTTGAQTEQKSQTGGDSFFIISSVDAKKQQLVLKLPTEVTEVVQITPATTYRDEEGKTLKFEDLRAGDTVYAKLARNGKGTLTVVSIRRGPMTLEELHRRYFTEE